ncbi:MAG: nucleotidyltransferase family protein [Clostridia bacterium]|nr:nucleotidyltransferase family protein [Clostridia bacterium]
MASVVGVICEYNPFHKGHKYQIDRIKADMPDATIIAIMSGNIVQRGEFAIMSKYERAKIALECGANAVVEIPYPYSGSTAEIFANAGVEIADKLGCDYLYFGTENFKIEEIEKIAVIIDSDEFGIELEKARSNKDSSFITAKSIALKKWGYELPTSANDMLALEYIRAILKKKLSIRYRNILRIGARYNDTGINDIMSASAIRKYYYDNDEFVSVPSVVEDCYKRTAKEGLCIDKGCVERLLHSFSLMYLDVRGKYFDTSIEMLSLIKTMAKECNSSQEFVNSLSSKAFTSARLRRAILYSMFNVVDLDFNPRFTTLLGMDKKGREQISKVKKNWEFTIITKHSDSKKLDSVSLAYLEKNYMVDALYNTLLKNQSSANSAFKNAPIIKRS